MKKYLVIGMAATMLVSGLLLLGCQKDKPQSTTMPVGSEQLTNYIVASAEDHDWAAYYNPGDTYFKLTIPIAGAVKIQYTVIQGAQTGSTFTIVLQTKVPTTHEIGLKTFEVDGVSVTDVVDCVTVEYVENGHFAQMPANAEMFEKSGSQYAQYKRVTGESESQEWWPVDKAADFEFSAGTQVTMRPYCQRQLFVAPGKPAVRPTPVPTVVPTPVPTPTPAAWCTAPVAMYGFNWRYVRGGESCTSGCNACGGAVDAAGLTYFVGNGNAATECAAIATAITGSTASGAINTRCSKFSPLCSIHHNLRMIL